jgi:hypothetical protein
MGVDDFLGGEDFLELSVVGRPAHPFRLGYIVAYAAISPELAPQLEGATQRPIVRGFALRAIGEPVRLAQRVPPSLRSPPPGAEKHVRA